MASVVVTETARADLDELIRTRGLPASTRDRVRASAGLLASFPRLGQPLAGRWDPFRFILGPWPWMLLVYVYDERIDRVAIVTIQDARSAVAPTSER